MARSQWLLIALAGGLALAGAARADRLVTIEGRTFEGRVITEGPTKVVFEIHQYGAKLRKTFRRQEVKYITRGPIETKGPDPGARPKRRGEEAKVIPPEPEAPPVVKYDKPTYYVIPIEEVIGMHVTASYLERCLDAAARRKPTVVVLSIDSPGGYIHEVDKLVEIIRKNSRQFHIVAYVRKAVSAAAITSLAVKELYFAPQAIFGAATAYTQDAFGLPSAIAEKFQSVWRARARSAADIGGHSPMLAEAMIDRNMELYAHKHKNGIISIKAGKAPGGDKQITSKGKLLTLTAGEAMEAGLAKAVVGDIVLLGEELEHKEWVECKGHAKLLAAHRKEALSGYIRKIRELQDEFTRNMERAWENRPETPKIPYRYDQRTGLYAAESRRRWRSRSRECAMWLMKAEGNIKKLQDLTESFEELKDSADYYRRLSKEVVNIRLEIMRKMNKRGPDD